MSKEGRVNPFKVRKMEFRWTIIDKCNTFKKENVSRIPMEATYLHCISLWILLCMYVSMYIIYYGVSYNVYYYDPAWKEHQGQ